jgi:cytoskeletal protein CcmA (bactofilin family)
MFTKSADPTAAPAPRASNTKSVLAADLKISGEIISTGDVEMAGEVEGTITARSLSITADGRMNGSVKAEALEVRGTLDGDVDAGTFTLRASAQVGADVTYGALVIESGAQIEGRFTRKK